MISISRSRYSGSVGHVGRKSLTSRGGSMRRKITPQSFALFALLLCLMSALMSGQQVDGNLLPDGFYIIPTAAPGSTFNSLPPGLRPDGSANANGAVNTALSPDGTALPILTTGPKTGFYTQGEAGSAILWPSLDPL